MNDQFLVHCASLLIIVNKNKGRLYKIRNKKNRHDDHIICMMHGFCVNLQAYKSFQTLSYEHGNFLGAIKTINSWLFWTANPMLSSKIFQFTRIAWMALLATKTNSVLIVVFLQLSQTLFRKLFQWFGCDHSLNKKSYILA